MTLPRRNFYEKIGWANIALALAFILAAFVAPGGKLLSLAIETPVLHSIPAYQTHLLNILVNHLIPAVVIYLLLRAARVEYWLKPRAAIHVLIGLGNALLILYLAPRVLASTVQGGGASFVVAMFAPYFVYPARFLFLAGFVWLIARSVRLRDDLRERQFFTKLEWILVAVVLAAPISVAATLFVGENAPFQIARKAQKILVTKCALAGEKISQPPSGPVKGVYFDPDGGNRYERIKDGIYSGYGSGILGEPLVNSGLLQFMEKRNDRPRAEEDGQAKYRRHVLKDWKGMPVNELESEYGVFQRDLTTEDDRRLGIRGTEVSIRNLRTNDEVATSTYFISSKHRRFCGHAPNGDFSVTTFVIRALHLTRQYPSAWDTNPAPKK